MKLLPGSGPRCTSHILTAGGPGSHGATEAQGGGLGHNLRSQHEENCAKFAPIPETAVRAKHITLKITHYIIERWTQWLFSTHRSHRTLPQVRTPLRWKFYPPKFEGVYVDLPSTIPGLKKQSPAKWWMFLHMNNPFISSSHSSEETGPLAPLIWMDILKKDRISFEKQKEGCLSNTSW